MFEYIKDAGLKPSKPYTKRAKTDTILIHHVEGDMSPQAIHAMHIENGHKGIDYNLYTAKNGDVFNGRGLEYEGGSVSNSHPPTKGLNARSVAIVCNGNFNKESMPDVQFESLVRVTKDVKEFYNIPIENIKLHKDACTPGYTDCPGKYFPKSGLMERLKEADDKPRSMIYVTTDKVEIYKKDPKQPTIGEKNELELLAYTGGKYALVRNPKTGNQFILEYDKLKEKE